MSEKDLNKIIAYIDKIKSEWISHVSEKLYQYEKKSGTKLKEIDEEIKMEMLKHISWLQEDMRLLILQINPENKNDY